MPWLDSFSTMNSDTPQPDAQPTQPSRRKLSVTIPLENEVDHMQAQLQTLLDQASDSPAEPPIPTPEGSPAELPSETAEPSRTDLPFEQPTPEESVFAPETSAPELLKAIADVDALLTELEPSGSIDTLYSDICGMLEITPAPPDAAPASTDTHPPAVEPQAEPEPTRSAAVLRVEEPTPE